MSSYVSISIYLNQKKNHLDVLCEKWHYDKWKGGRVFPQNLEFSFFGSTKEWDNN